LNQADIYIIVDPDVPKENINAKYIEPEDAKTIFNWVNDGGVLVMMANDTGNLEIDHFNILASKFGIQFNKEKTTAIM
jgi:unsaturated rhamnogalacturonyl hydrolase